MHKGAIEVYRLNKALSSEIILPVVPKGVVLVPNEVPDVPKVTKARQLNAL